MKMASLIGMDRLRISNGSNKMNMGERYVKRIQTFSVRVKDVAYNVMCPVLVLALVRMSIRSHTIVMGQSGSDTKKTVSSNAISTVYVM